MKSILLILSLVLTFTALAQPAKTEYFNTRWLSCLAQGATYYREYTRDVEGYKVAEYTIAGERLMTGHVESINDEYTIMRKGLFKYYDLSSHKIKEGVYDFGKLEGLWKYYYPGKDSVDEEIYYVAGVIVSRKAYESGTHLLKSETQYSEGKYERSTSYTYYADGKLKKKSRDIMGKKMPAECYDRKGKIVKCETEIDKNDTVKQPNVKPAATFDIATYLSENVIYPSFARKNKIEGRVLIEFTVSEVGEIGSIKLTKSVCPQIDEEALRVVMLMPKWPPIMKNNKPVCVVFTQPITFKLQ